MFLLFITIWRMQKVIQTTHHSELMHLPLCHTSHLWAVSRSTVYKHSIRSTVLRWHWFLQFHVYLLTQGRLLIFQIKAAHPHDSPGTHYCQLTMIRRKSGENLGGFQDVEPGIVQEFSTPLTSGSWALEFKVYWVLHQNIGLWQFLAVNGRILKSVHELLGSVLIALHLAQVFL